MTLEQADTNLMMAYRAYFKAQPEFPQWKEEFQIELIEAVTEDTGKTAKQIKAQMKRENTNELWAIMLNVYDRKMYKIPFFEQWQPTIPGNF